MVKRSLRLYIVVLSLHASFLASNCLSANWEDEKQEWEKLSSTRFYKDPGYAAKLALNFLPIDNGHFYVGEVGKGIWFSMGETVSLVALAVPLLNSRARQDKEPVWTTGMIASASAGGVIYLALKVWSAYDAADGARRYNAAQEAAHPQKQGWRWDVEPRRIILSRRFE